MDRFILCVSSRKLTQAGGQREFTVGDRDFLVGSAPDCDFVLKATGIEARHLVFRPREDLLVLVPLTRRGEIALNSRVVKHAVVLGEGDTVSVADTKIEVRVERDRKQPSAPPRTKDDDFAAFGAERAKTQAAPKKGVRIMALAAVALAVVACLLFVALRHPALSGLLEKKAPGLAGAVKKIVPEKAPVMEIIQDPEPEDDGVEPTPATQAPPLEESLPAAVAADTAPVVMERAVVSVEEETVSAPPAPPAPDAPPALTYGVQEGPVQQEAPARDIDEPAVEDSADRGGAIDWQELDALNQTAVVTEPDTTVVTEEPAPFKLVANAPVPVEVLLAVADDYDSGRIDRALRDIKKISASSPADKNAARLKRKIEDVAGAWSALSRAHSPAAAYIAARRITAAESESSNFYRREADRRLASLLEHPDALAEECRQNGLMLQAESRHEEALENFRAALELNPNDSLAGERIRTLELIVKNRRASLYKAGYVLEPGDKSKAEKIWERL